jgi:hypothetical protein
MLQVCLGASPFVPHHPLSFTVSEIELTYSINNILLPHCEDRARHYSAEDAIIIVATAASATV